MDRDLEKGKRVVFDSLLIADELGAKVCVFHAWDTWKEDFNIDHLRGVITDIAAQFPNVKSSVENIPSHMEGCKYFDLVNSFDYVTLDLVNSFDIGPLICGFVFDADLGWGAIYNDVHLTEEIV